MSESVRGKAQAKAQARGGKRSQANADPVAFWLTMVIFAVILLWGIAVLSAIVFGVVGQPAAPRRAAERDLMELTAQVEGGKANTQVYARYVSVLIGADQLNKAQAALDDALKSAKTDKSYLIAEGARLAFAREDWQATIEEADKAIAEANKEMEAARKANIKNNRNPNAGVGTPQSYKTAALVKADALMNLKSYAKAVKAYDVYLKESPIDSDIFVRRGLAKIKTNDKKGAEADFREALKYVPDFQPALDGLKKIGVSK